LFVTAESEDPLFNKPYIDLREWRDEPEETTLFPGGVTAQPASSRPIQARHLYVHGGFEGTDAKFSFCFPPEEEYDGRFFQSTHQLLTGEVATPRNVAFALASGGYSVQTNMGGRDNPRTSQATSSGRFDTTIRGYRVNAEAAKFSRVVAAEIYGDHRTYGYLYGGSGGAYQTVASAEMTDGVWDGFLPYVMGSPQSIPNCFTIRINALRVLKDKWPSILDAIEPGGSGDPYAGLNDEERTALEEATRTGFPPRAWFNYIPQGRGTLTLVANLVPALDPTYADDFWSKPGYLGTDAASSIGAARIQHEATVVAVIPGREVKLQLTSIPSGDPTGADLVITSGPAAGRTVAIGVVVGDTVGFTRGADHPRVTQGVKVGDEVRIDNSRFLALQTYHRHQFPPSNPDYDYPDVHDYYRKPDGTPKYPQRGVDIGEAGTLGATGHIPTGRFHGKMIVLETLLDGDALPWQADWYHKKVEAIEGPNLDERYRLWYVDNAQHNDPTTDLEKRHAVSYFGTLQFALRELAAWVERGVAPPPTSAYRVRGGQVELPASAAERRGIQPVVRLRAHGAERADVAVGAAVTFTAEIELPSGPGKVVSVQWDFEGRGTYADAASFGDPTSEPLHVSATHTFGEPGTYFPAVRVASQREGDPNTPHARSLNLGRVRVVVA
jgi:hypothetical protein